MVARDDERTRAPLHGVVSLRRALGLAAGLALIAAVAGGLGRAGLGVPGAGAHGALLLGAFFGGVIALERAVALRAGWAFAVPAAALAAGALRLAGRVDAAAWLGVAAAAGFVAVNAVLLHRSREPHTALLGIAALAWLAAQWAAATGAGDPLPAWFAFPVLTVVAERLEMTRLMRRRAAAAPLLVMAVAVTLTGAALGSHLAWGTGLLMLAGWLALFDIARRTVRARGLPRYMALCLLSGYAWLAVAGLAWIGMAFGCPWRDLALHALGLGFLVAMVMGHAPVVLPAVARVKVRFSAALYAPLALLQVSLLLRFGGQLQAGALLNAATLLLFAATMVHAAGRRNPRWTTPASS